MIYVNAIKIHEMYDAIARIHESRTKGLLFKRFVPVTIKI